MFSLPLTLSLCSVYFLFSAWHVISPSINLSEFLTLVTISVLLCLQQERRERIGALFGTDEIFYACCRKRRDLPSASAVLLWFCGVVVSVHCIFSLSLVSVNAKIKSFIVQLQNKHKCKN